MLHALNCTQKEKRQWRRKAKLQKQAAKRQRKGEGGAGYQPITKENALLEKYYQVKRKTARSVSLACFHIPPSLATDPTSSWVGHAYFKFDSMETASFICRLPSKDGKGSGHETKQETAEQPVEWWCLP